MISIFTTTAIIPISSDDVNDMLGWASQIIVDLKLLWLAVVGVILGVVVIAVILRELKK